MAAQARKAVSPCRATRRWVSACRSSRCPSGCPRRSSRISTAIPSIHATICTTPTSARRNRNTREREGGAGAARGRCAPRSASSCAAGDCTSSCRLSRASKTSSISSPRSSTSPERSGGPVRHRGLPAAARSAPSIARRDARSRRHRSERPSVIELGGARREHAALYEEARLTRLGTEKFMLDGRHTGTGGGNHMTLGGATTADSPFLRRPDLLRSLVTYWQNHPALSYLFSRACSSGRRARRRASTRRATTGCTSSRSPFSRWTGASGGRGERLPVARRPAAAALPRRSDGQHAPRRILDRQALLARSPTGRLGLAGVARVRDAAASAHGARSGAARARIGGPVLERAVPRQLVSLGHATARPLDAAALRPAGPPRRGHRSRAAGYALREEWFAPFFEFRFPRYGTVTYAGVTLELRQAIEPWHVLGEEIAGTGTSRSVDRRSSACR